MVKTRNIAIGVFLAGSIVTFIGGAAFVLAIFDDTGSSACCCFLTLPTGILITMIGIVWMLVDLGNSSVRIKGDAGSARQEKGEVFPPGQKGKRFLCPYCDRSSNIVIERKISTTGWILFAILLFFFLPLCWIGLLIKEDYRVCSNCRRELSLMDLRKPPSEREKEPTGNEVRVDGNIFSTIRSNELAVPYICPNCRGSLEITGSDPFERCPYCGASFDLEAIETLAKSLLK